MIFKYTGKSTCRIPKPQNSSSFNVNPEKKEISKIRSPFCTFIEAKEKLKVNENPKILPVYNISAILASGNDYRVIINEQIYRIGDKIGDSVIKNISKNKVFFETQGTVHEVSINK